MDIKEIPGDWVGEHYEIIREIIRKINEIVIAVNDLKNKEKKNGKK